MAKYHVEVTVEGREDGLVIARHHFDSISLTAAYVSDVHAHPLGGYLAEVEHCGDTECESFDITRPRMYKVGPA